MYVLKVKNGKYFEIQPRFFKRISEKAINGILYHELQPINKCSKFVVFINTINGELLDAKHDAQYQKVISKIDFWLFLRLLCSYPIQFMKAIFKK